MNRDTQLESIVAKKATKKAAKKSAKKGGKPKRTPSQDMEEHPHTNGEEQGELFDASPEEAKLIDPIARELLKARKNRMNWGRTESELSDKLLGAMKEIGKKDYQYDGVIVRVVVTEEKVKVKIKKDDSDEVEVDKSEE